jgi:glyoxylase-like metal-dependent hydrolase (beta-lactamase superfamily II)
MDLGKGGLAVALFGLTTVACSNDPSESGSTTTGGDAGQAATTGPQTTGPQTTNPETTSPETTSPETTTPETTSPTATEAAVWERVNLGFVSAYVLARRGEATIVDTGVAGSEGDIEASLGVLDMGWADVSHVIVTHLHPDHQGSLPAVMDLATGATGYAGAGDIAGISSPRDLVAVGDGDHVFDLAIIETPGHTPGHISVLDPAGGLLIAGDALNGADGGVIGANPDFSSDMDMAAASVQKLAELSFATVVFGHGEPVIGNASAQVAELASG